MRPPFLSDPDKAHEVIRYLAKSLKNARREQDEAKTKNLEYVLGRLNARYPRLLARRKS